MNRLAKTLIFGSACLAGLAATPARAGYTITTSLATSSSSTSTSGNAVTVYASGTSGAGSGASATGSLTLASPMAQVASGSSMNLVLANASTTPTGTSNPQTNFSANVMITITVTSTTTNMTGTIVVDDMLGGTFNNNNSAGSNSIPTYAQTSSTTSFIGPSSVMVDGTTFSVAAFTNGNNNNKIIYTSTPTNFSLADFGSSLQISPAIVPEPSSVVMVLSGLGGLAMVARRRRAGRVI